MPVPLFLSNTTFQSAGLLTVNSSIHFTHHSFASQIQLPMQSFLFICVLTCYIMCGSNCLAQQSDEVSLLSYNLLNYPDPSNVNADTALRNPYYRTIIAATNPDLLVVEEMNSQSGVNGFLSKVMNASAPAYAAGAFIDGPDTDNCLFYKTGKFVFVSNNKIKTDLRNISEFKLVHIFSGDTIRIYAVHLKASSGTANELQRALEVDSLRKVTNALPAGSNFIVCGDFNFYAASESGYQKLLQVNGSNEGHFIDPITMTGSWNNSSYAIHHTQSTRTRSFGGGSTGGMDDRFDLILYSKAISQSGGVTYVVNSETGYGNDGNHYNDSINRMPNSSVSLNIANALHYASDHLPVIGKFNFQYGAAAPPDVGVLALILPASSICPVANQTLQVQVKNFGADTVKFSSYNLQVTIVVTNPSAVNHTFSKTITTGSLAGNASFNITFDSTYNMSVAGTYTFNSYTVMSVDANAANNAMSPSSVVVNPNPAVTISPAGPVSICNGSSVTLTASSGNSYLWSTGETTQSISVSTAGNYFATVSISTGCFSTSATVVVSTISQPNGNVFAETMGSVTTTTAITLHESNNGFDNDNLTMSGTADVRNTQSSSGLYAGASGGANIFITNTASRNFIVSGINTMELANLQLSFGIFKSTTASTGGDLLVQFSSDGITYTNLSFSALPTGSGTSNWYYRTATGAIPALANLWIKFIQTGTVTQYRIDDVTLTYSGNVPVISSNVSTTICNGESVMLTVNINSGYTYAWNKDGIIIPGATNQNLSVTTNGSYTCSVSNACSTTSSNSIAVIVNNCNVTVQLKFFIEGYYIGGGMMKPVLSNVGIDTDPASIQVDTVTIELFDAATTDFSVASVKTVLQTDGLATCVFPGEVSGNSYYIAIHYKNALQTWSAAPVLMDTSVFYDFSFNITQAFPDPFNPNPQMVFFPADGVWAIYSGDIDQNGSIDGGDFNAMEPDVTFPDFGYNISDITGDGIPDGQDYNLL
ncbi:MAG: endonuclease/exonuclease/phosphatase family protein, partial [Chitinophagales bacterium]